MSSPVGKLWDCPCFTYVWLTIDRHHSFTHIHTHTYIHSFTSRRWECLHIDVCVRGSVGWTISLSLSLSLSHTHTWSGSSAVFSECLYDCCTYYIKNRTTFSLHPYCTNVTVASKHTYTHTHRHTDSIDNDCCGFHAFCMEKVQLLRSRWYGDDEWLSEWVREMNMQMSDQ